MGARNVAGLVRVGGGDSSILIQFSGNLDPRCFEALKREFERLARDCGIKVKQFKLGKKIKIKKKAKKK